MGCGASATDTEVDNPAVPDVEIVDEEDALAEDIPVDPAVIPEYWVNKNIGDGTQGFDALIYVSPEHFPLFDDILNQTYMPRVTQDRPCPTGEHDRVRGGCPCVQPGGAPGLPTKYRTRQVLRVEDSGMWSRYIDKVQSIKDARRGDKFHLFKPAVLSNQITTKSRHLFAPLEKHLNEVYLFHGTRVRYALSIAQDDFRIDLAGSSRGTMYGAGAYLAECSTKADEYAMDEKDGYYEGVYALLLCRVCMGKMFYTRKRCEEAGEKIQDGSHDSTLGDRARPPTNTFRELVVYDADQLYPEYIILYQRVYANDDENELEQKLAIPFHMQLPLYWTNAHKDPDGDDGFDNQYVVRSATKDVFQQLMEASVPDGGLTISRVRRIENSGVWSRYVVCKKTFREKLDDPNGRFDNQLVVESTPKQLLADILSGGDAEQLMSLGDIDERVNEHLLWFGGPKENIEWMARGIEMGNRVTDWSISKAKFSCGLLQSLRNAKPDEDGVRYLLLCRVALGDAIVSENPDSDVVTTSDAVIFRSTEENPSDRATVCEESQVYAEYIFEITGGDELVGVEEEQEILPEDSADFLLPAPEATDESSRE